MKHLQLIKCAQATNLAHLYEHIFCATLNAYFRTNELYARLDYSLSVQVLPRGLMVLDLTLYSAKAKQLAHLVHDLQVHFSEESIVTASTQILAKHERPIVCKNMQQVQHALTRLHSIPWENNKNMNRQLFRETRSPFYIAKGRPLPARKLYMSIILNTGEVNTALLPLFREMASLTIDNLEETLADTFGYYSAALHFTKNKKEARLTNIYKVANNNDPSVLGCSQLAENIVHQMIQKNVFKYYLANRQNLTHCSSAPSSIITYKDTHVWVTPQGWTQLATVQNLAALFPAMHLELVWGRQRLRSRSFKELGDVQNL